MLTAHEWFDVPGFCLSALVFLGLGYAMVKTVSDIERMETFADKFDTTSERLLAGRADESLGPPSKVAPDLKLESKDVAALVSTAGELFPKFQNIMDQLRSENRSSNVKYNLKARKRVEEKIKKRVRRRCVLRQGLLTRMRHRSEYGRCVGRLEATRAPRKHGRPQNPPKLRTDTATVRRHLATGTLT